MQQLIAVAATLGLASVSLGQDVKTEDLKDGFVRVTTPTYTIELPKAWKVGKESSFGQREMWSEEGRMSAMTAPGGGRQGWEQLYRTSLYFIQREGPGKPTPYKITKSAQGYEACSFSILDDEGFAKKRYVILKATNDNILALSIKIPDKKKEKDLAATFDRLVKTAKVN